MIIPLAMAIAWFTGVSILWDGGDKLPSTKKPAACSCEAKEGSNEQ